MRKTKIICTIGPASENPEILSQIIEAGMNVSREVNALWYERCPS